MFDANSYNLSGFQENCIEVLFFDESIRCLSDLKFCNSSEIAKLEKHLKNMSVSNKFSCTLLPSSKDCSYYLCVQIENPQKITASQLESIGVTIGKMVSKTSVENLEIIWPEINEQSDLKQHFCACLFKGMLISDYDFLVYKNDKKTEVRPKFKINHKTNNQAQLNRMFSDMILAVSGENLCKDLMHEPPNKLTPIEFSNRISKLEEIGLSIDILDEKRLNDENMHALLAVGQGSKQESRLACIQWAGASSDLKDPICLVGKGVCFDSGGINIKLSNLVEMKYDMGGAACVVGAMKSIALLKLPVNVVGVVALTENMSGSDAYRPSDIISSRSGKTIEILNTDAEGRLILADALDYTADVYKPKAMIDLATLTGAIIVGLGHEYAGLYANDEDLLQALKNAAKHSFSKLWQMPLDPAYDKQVDSPIADIQNLGASPGAGSITAAQFLQRFTKNIPWAHIDIAGTAWRNSPNGVYPKGPTGYGVSLLIELIKQYAK